MHGLFIFGAGVFAGVVVAMVGTVLLCAVTCGHGRGNGSAESENEH